MIGVYRGIYGAVRMQVANVKLRQILPRMGKIWACTPQIAEDAEDADDADSKRCFAVCKGTD